MVGVGAVATLWRWLGEVSFGVLYKFVCVDCLLILTGFGLLVMIIIGIPMVIS